MHDVELYPKTHANSFGNPELSNEEIRMDSPPRNNRTIGPDDARRQRGDRGERREDMAERIEVTPMTEYTLDGRANSTQTIVLRERIPMVMAVSAVLEARVHSTGGLTGTASIKVRCFPQSQSREDPGIFFVGDTALAETAAITSSTQPPVLLTDTFDTPIPSMVRVVLELAQGGTATGAQTLTLGVDLIVRPG
jgi:hypothetical protein